MIVDASFVDKINTYLENLQGINNYEYYPSSNGITEYGNKLQLGFSCYALKILFITKKWENLKDSEKNDWIDYINSFQANFKNLPNNSYIDPVFIDDYGSFNFNRFAKNIIKKSLSLFDLYSYDDPLTKLKNNIRAETKQAIATLYQVGNENKLEYLEFENKTRDINEFLSSFNWNRPWHAGAQFSALCVFNSTQLKDENRRNGINDLNKFIESKLDLDTGLYYEDTLPSISESINGSMKVLSGLDWLDSSIHLPEKLIDFCLETKPSNEGCDLVDVVYVLYRCSKETDYKKKEISKYFKIIEEIIFSHYKSDEGGFSYFINNSQEYYYGLKVTNGNNVADIHGTILLLWAISMIYDFENEENQLFNIIKP